MRYLTYKETIKLDLSNLCFHSSENIEHDGSCSRLDTTLSNNQQGAFDHRRFNKVFSFSRGREAHSQEDAQLFFEQKTFPQNCQTHWKMQYEDQADNFDKQIFPSCFI